MRNGGLIRDIAALIRSQVPQEGKRTPPLLLGAQIADDSDPEEVGSPRFRGARWISMRRIYAQSWDELFSPPRALPSPPPPPHVVAAFAASLPVSGSADPSPSPSQSL